MDKKKTDQIRAMLDAHIDADTIMKVLGVTKLDIVGFTEYEKEPEEKKQPEPQKEIAVSSGPGSSPRFTEEIFNEAKQLRADGYSIKAVARKLGFSASYLYSVIGKNSYEDVIKLRKKQANYKRAATEKRRRAKKAEQFADIKAIETATPGKVYPSAEGFDPNLAELRAINDTLQQIAETLRKTHRRGLFRK